MIRPLVGFTSAIELGERNVSLQNIVKLARPLAVKPERLLKGIAKSGARYPKRAERRAGGLRSEEA